MKNHFRISGILIVGLLLTLLAAGTVLAQPPAGEPYTVQAGDELGKLAEKVYGDPLAYPAIVKATNAKAAEDDSFAVITDPDVIEIGQKLWLPTSGGSGETGGAMAPAAPANGSRLTVEQLKNATYSGIYDQPVTLTGGKFEGEPFVEGGASRPTVWYIDNSETYGDLNGDGGDDSAVLLVENSGGSGVFSYAGAQLNQAGQPLDAGTAPLGDRTQLISMSIANQQVVAEIVTPGPDEALCCGTLKVRKTLALQDGKLAEVGSEELGNVSLDDLMGTHWVLERLDRDQPVLTGTIITADFAEGQVAGSAGCNSYNASVSSDGGQNLAVGPAISTQMACGQAVMDQELAYLTALQGATRWSYQPGQLAVTYSGEDGLYGTLFYDPAPAAEQAAPAESMDSAEMAAAPTEVITYNPTAVPAERRAGSCFANAIGLGRADAWRCTVENQIFDPCFEVGQEPAIVCGAGPATGDIGFALALAEPLPVPEPGNLLQPWLVELAGGQACGLMTGTVPGVGNRVAPYGCPDGSNLFDNFQQGEVWMAEKAVIGLNDGGFFIEQSETVPLARVWQ